ncbi:ABC tran domain containing protein, partial [Asbolus verrucosus]
MSDVLYGIKLIKMCSWEQPFEQLIDTARNKHFTSVELFLQGVANSDSCFLNILTVILAGMPLTPQYVFVTAWVYRRLKFLVSTGLPYAVISISEVAISMKRIENFLKFHCSNLFEIELKKGTLHVGGTLSYASQEPWIFSTSVKQNIFFGAEMDQNKYLKVIRVCALEHDLARFLFGDRTLVGERRVMLSGGQKARINLARAIYRDADVYLLDDPLSTVDDQVAKQIFDEGILGYLKGKCVVLVTHQVQFFRDVKRVYNLEQEPENFDVKLKTELTTNSCLYIYSAFIFLIIITYITMFCFIQHSKRLHNRMLTRVIHGSMTFFNFHISGRILIRFAQDIGNIVVLMFTLYSYHQIFHPTIKNAKRTERITSFQGLTTIRAFSVQKRLEGEFDNHQNLNTSASYMALALHSCLDFWVDMTCAVYTALVIFGFLLGKETKVGNVGMAITQAMLLLEPVQFGMGNWINLDNQMTSVERILEYSELEQEIDGGNFPGQWPNGGNIELQSVSMRYSPDNPMVLQNVFFKVRSGEKVGIVGRTGAGKTSLISTLFRLFDFNGTITVDGVNIKSIPLKIL